MSWYVYGESVRCNVSLGLVVCIESHRQVQAGISFGTFTHLVELSVHAVIRMDNSIVIDMWLSLFARLSEHLYSQSWCMDRSS